jgi:hypothetical protein
VPASLPPPHGSPLSSCCKSLPSPSTTSDGNTSSSSSCSTSPTPSYATSSARRRRAEPSKRSVGRADGSRMDAAYAYQVSCLGTQTSKSFTSMALLCGRMSNPAKTSSSKSTPRTSRRGNLCERCIQPHSQTLDLPQHTQCIAIPTVVRRGGAGIDLVDRRYTSRSGCIQRENEVIMNRGPLVSLLISIQGLNPIHVDGSRADVSRCKQSH